MHPFLSRVGLLPFLSLAAPALAAALPLAAHDDDPKILDRRPPVLGPGYLPGAPGGGSTQPPTAMGSRVNLESWMTLLQLDGAQSGNDCWGYVSGSGREYAIICTYEGTNWVEITNPGNPQLVASRSGPQSLWRDVKVYQNYAYVVSEGGSGIQVFNMANIDNGTVTLANTVTSGGTTSTHNVAIDTVSGFLYRLGGGSNGARIYNLANPASPSFVGSWSTRYIHDAQVVTHTSGAYAGKQLLYACSGFNGGFDDTGLTILDVTNKGNIQVLSQSYYPGAEYSHQGWLTPDLSTFYLGDELDEDGVKTSTWHVFDVSDPGAAKYLGQYTNGNTAVTHNLYTQGEVMYAANYTSGLRVIDISDPTDPFEYGFWDTFGGGNPASFNGLWNVFPYFPSGSVIGSDLESGLYVWTVDPAPVRITLPNGRPDLIDPAGESVAVTIEEGLAGDLLVGSEMLVYDVGGGPQFVPLSSQGGSSYTAVFPAIACGTEVSWYIQASDTQGGIWRRPSAAPGQAYSSTAAIDIDVAVDHDMESNQGWISGAPGDTATTGVWTRVNPRGTGAQPEDDHTEAGNQCWVTGQGSVGGSIGENDVDNGATTLRTPVMDLTGYTEPVIRYWRWYSNDAGASPNEDVFRIDISDNGGVTWTSVEQVGPTGIESSGGWYEHTFTVSDLVIPTAAVQMRFIAEDAINGSIVEAAIDDFQVVETVCEDGTIGTSYCSETPNSTGLPALISATGSDVAADNDVTLHATQLPPNKNGYFLTSDTQGFVQNPGGSQGDLCLGGQVRRYSKDAANSGAAGELSLTIDLTDLPGAGGGAVMGGETWYYQAWFRDQNPGQTSNFTNGLSVSYQ